MTTYLYVLSVPQTLPEAKFQAAKEELCKLFECETVAEDGHGQWQVLTHLEPLQVDKAIRQFSARYGRVEFRAGTKFD